MSEKKVVGWALVAAAVVVILSGSIMLWLEVQFNSDLAKSQALIQDYASVTQMEIANSLYKQAIPYLSELEQDTLFSELSKIYDLKNPTASRITFDSNYGYTFTQKVYNTLRNYHEKWSWSDDGQKVMSRFAKLVDLSTEIHNFKNGPQPKTIDDAMKQLKEFDKLKDRVTANLYYLK
jgi:hypothetical protein